MKLPWDVFFSIVWDSHPSLGLFAVIVRQSEMSPDLIKSEAHENLSTTQA